MDALAKNGMLNYAYLLKLISAAINEAQPEEPEPGVNFGQVYKIACSHLVENTAFYAVEKLKNKPEAGLFKKWQNKRNKAFHRNMTQRAELESIKSAFSLNGIEYLPLKGFPVCDLYPQSDYRFMSDLDILVKDIKKADEIITSLGYEPKEVGMHHHDEFSKPPFMYVEIHRDLVGADSDFYDYYKKIFDRAKSLGSCAYELSHEDFYIYSIIHLENHYAKAGTGIRSISDLFLMNKKFLPGLDTAYIESELRKLGLRDLRNLLSDIAEKWFKNNDFTDFSEAELRILFSGAYGTVENKINAAKGDRGSFAFLMRRIFPTAKSMKWVFPWLKDYPFLLPWAYVYRIFRDGIGKRKKAAKEIRKLKQKN